MKTLLTSSYHQAMQTAITLLLVIIVLAIPSASFSDINYYKALFAGYIKILFTITIPKINYHVKHTD